MYQILKHPEYDLTALIPIILKTTNHQYHKRLVELKDESDNFSSRHTAFG